MTAFYSREAGLGSWDLAVPATILDFGLLKALFWSFCAFFFADFFFFARAPFGACPLVAGLVCVPTSHSRPVLRPLGNLKNKFGGAFQLSGCCLTFSQTQNNGCLEVVRIMVGEVVPP